MKSPDEALRLWGWTLPPPPKALAAYVPSIRVGDLLFVSGQLPFRDGALLAVGAVPSRVSPEQAASAASQCVLNALSLIREEVGGDWSRLIRIARVGVFVQSDIGFGGQPTVANGASETLIKLLGDEARHARVAVGVNALPLDASVEVELLAEIR
ncbi:MAG: RidA family protein [Kiritimatiellia bacterium]|nr:RidA family protein [Kiritimatiellia bacterium]